MALSRHVALTRDDGIQGYCCSCVCCKQAFISHPNVSANLSQLSRQYAPEQRTTKPQFPHHHHPHFCSMKQDLNPNEVGYLTQSIATSTTNSAHPRGKHAVLDQTPHQRYVPSSGVRVSPTLLKTSTIFLGSILRDQAVHL